MIVSLSTVAGCSDDYDDSQLRGDLSELSGRVEKLEQSVAKLNGDYTALSGIVDALEGKVYVSKVDPIADGYRITFSEPIETLYQYIDGNLRKDSLFLRLNTPGDLDAHDRWKDRMVAERGE